MPSENERIALDLLKILNGFGSVDSRSRFIQKRLEHKIKKEKKGHGKDSGK